MRSVSSKTLTSRFSPKPYVLCNAQSIAIRQVSITFAASSRRSFRYFETGMVIVFFLTLFGILFLLIVAFKTDRRAPTQSIFQTKPAGFYIGKYFTMSTLITKCYNRLHYDALPSFAFRIRTFSACRRASCVSAFSCKEASTSSSMPFFVIR